MSSLALSFTLILLVCVQVISMTTLLWKHLLTRTASHTLSVSTLQKYLAHKIHESLHISRHTGTRILWLKVYVLFQHASML
jgi:hypothetical protein